MSLKSEEQSPDCWLAPLFETHRAELDRGHYPAGVAVTDAQLARVRLERHRFHGDWNYTIRPAKPGSVATVVS